MGAQRKAPGDQDKFNSNRSSGLKAIQSLDAKIYWWRSWASGSDLPAGALEAFLRAPHPHPRVDKLKCLTCVSRWRLISPKRLWGSTRCRDPSRWTQTIRGVVLGVRDHLQSSS